MEGCLVLIGLMVVVVPIVLLFSAWSRSTRALEKVEEIKVLQDQLLRLQERLKTLESCMRQYEASGVREAPDASLSKPLKPVVTQLAQAPPLPPSPAPVPPVLECKAFPAPEFKPQTIEEAPHVYCEQGHDEAQPANPAAVKSEPQPVVVPVSESAPAPVSVPELPAPVLHQSASQDVPPMQPQTQHSTVKPSVPRPPAHAPRPQKPFKIEDFLASRFFLKAGVTVLVLGALFALGLVFQMMGPVGKILMSYALVGAMMAGSLWLEKKPLYQNIGRALLAGSWALVFVVTFAAGFMDAAKVFHSKPLAIGALFAASAGCVAFSLRYRDEMVTTGAFLLIHLSLGMAGHYLAAPLSLSAAVMVSLALALLALRLKWFRMLGLGILATWINLALHIWKHHPAPSPQNLWGLGLVGLVFLAALVFGPKEEEHREDFAFTALGLGSTFLGQLALGIACLQGSSRAYWAGFTGALLVLCAVRFYREKRRNLYLYTGTLGVMALGLVTPLRLGLGHHLAPLMRLMGLEVVLAAGIYLKERYWRVLAYLGFAATAVELLAKSNAVPEIHRVSLLIAAFAYLGTAAMLRGPWKLAQEEEGPWLPAVCTWLGSLFVALLLLIYGSAPWMGLGFALVSLAWLGLGMTRDLKDLIAQGLCFSLLTLGTGLYYYPQIESLAALRLLFIAVILATGYGVALWRRTLAFEWREACAWCLSAFAMTMLTCLIFFEVSAMLASPLVALLGALLMGLALYMERNELMVESLLLAPVAGVGALMVPDATDRAWALAMVALLYLGQEILAHRWNKGHSDQPRRIPASLGAPVFNKDQGFSRITPPMMNLLACVSLCTLAFLELPSLYLAPAFALAGCLWGLWSLKEKHLYHFVNALFLSAIAFGCLLFHGRSAMGAGLGSALSANGFAFVLLYTSQFLWARMGDDEAYPHWEERLGVAERKMLASVLLWALALALGYFVKIHALAFGLNVLVAPVWAILALLHLERGKSSGNSAWLLLAHGGLCAAIVHFIGVNLMVEQVLGLLSLRLLTGLFVLGSVLYAYRFTPGLEDANSPKVMTELDRLARWKAIYLYGGLLLLALLLRFELNRAWVLPAWALLAVACLWRWQGRPGQAHNAHGTRSAALLALSAFVQGLAFNLVQRDQFRDYRLNLVVIPLAMIALLLAYVLLRKKDGEAANLSKTFDAGENRMIWLIPALVLGLAFLWIEMKGTLLTVVLSAYGLGIVALGFACREYFARMAGLYMLLFCILKLFIFDLRNLTGLPRVLSFLVLGLVLIGVSLIYTRFKSRQEAV